MRHSTGGLNKWSIELTRLSQRSVAVSHSIIHIAVSYGNSTPSMCAITGTTPCSSVTGMLNQLEWVPLATRRANMRLCMMYRVAHTPVGDPWTPWLTFAQRTTLGAGSHAWKYIPMATSHDTYKFSFLPRTIIAWTNCLPLS